MLRRNRRGPARPVIVIEAKYFRALLSAFEIEAGDERYRPGDRVIGKMAYNMAVPFPSQHPDSQLGNMQDVVAGKSYIWSLQ